MTVRYLAVALLVLAAMAFSALAAFADSINVLRPSRQPAMPTILFDADIPPLESDDEAALDRDCISFADRHASSSSTVGSASWHFGELAWDWHESQPQLIYLLCVTPRSDRSAIGGAMQMIAALSWSSLRATRSAERPPAPLAVTVGSDVMENDDPRDDGDRPLEDLPVTDELPPGGDWPVRWPAFSPLPREDFEMQSSAETAGASPISFDLPGATDDHPITLDPSEWANSGDLAPVPEPGTWLLTATGLAAAWRAARKRK
jgi:hypothetical protein